MVMLYDSQQPPVEEGEVKEVFLITLLLMFLFVKTGWWKASQTPTVMTKTLHVGTNTQVERTGEGVSLGPVVIG